MTSEVHVIMADATIQDAAKKMTDMHVGALPVCDRDQLIGFITDRDIVIRCTAEGLNPTEVRVRQVMTSPVTYGFDHYSEEDAAKLMKERGIRRLPVLDRDWRLVGIVTADDLMIEVPDREVARDVIERAVDAQRTPL